MDLKRGGEILKLLQDSKRIPSLLCSAGMNAVLAQLPESAVAEVCARRMHPYKINVCSKLYFFKIYFKFTSSYVSGTVFILFFMKVYFANIGYSSPIF